MHPCKMVNRREMEWSSCSFHCNDHSTELYIVNTLSSIVLVVVKLEDQVFCLFVWYSFLILHYIFITSYFFAHLTYYYLISLYLKLNCEFFVVFTFIKLRCHWGFRFSLIKIIDGERCKKNTIICNAYDFISSYRNRNQTNSDHLKVISTYFQLQN